jgi:hypothetical protein
VKLSFESIISRPYGWLKLGLETTSTQAVFQEFTWTRRHFSGRERQDRCNETNVSIPRPKLFTMFTSIIDYRCEDLKRFLICELTKKKLAICESTLVPLIGLDSLPECPSHYPQKRTVQLDDVFGSFKEGFEMVKI